MIVFQKMEWDNCFSYGKGNSIELNSDTLTQLVAANGSGKSSIPLILEEVLYNKNSKGIKKSEIPNRLLDGTYKINLDFLVDEVSYRIEVVRNKTAIKVKLFKEGQDISSHTAVNTFKQIEQLLKLDYKTFSQLVYQGISSSLQFLTATDTARKKFLIDLLGLELYLEHYELFKELNKDTTTQVATIEGKIAAINKWIKDNTITDTQFKEKLDIPEYESEKESELVQLKINCRDIDQTNQKIKNNELARQRLQEVSAEQIKVDISTPYDTTSLVTELGGLKSTALSISTALTKFQKLPGKCPTCCQEISEEFADKYVNAATTKTTELSSRITELEAEIAKKNKENLLLAKKIKAESEFESLYKSIDNSLPSDILIKDDLLDKINKLTVDLKAQKDLIDEITKQNLQIERHNTKLSIFMEQHDKMQAELEEHQGTLEELQAYATSIEILKKAFSTNGLVAYKIEGLVKELEDLANSYLAELSDGRFTLEFCIEKDKLNVNMTDEGNIISISALSSGELARVNTATLLAIRKLMSSISKSRINVLFLDEIINVLDEFGKEKLIEILLKEKDLNSFIVSHQWSHPLLSKISITKEGGLSRLE